MSALLFVPLLTKLLLTDGGIESSLPTHFEVLSQRKECCAHSLTRSVAFQLYSFISNYQLPAESIGDF